jgi:hypothetical protein
MPDFGIFRGFNDKLFGDKLYAGQLPTQLGIIGSEEVFDTDPDALAFFARVTAAGGTLSATEQLAIDTLVIQMKLDGIWTKMKAIYPMVGASAAACAQNLKSSSFTVTFTATGWTFAGTGATPNGTSAFAQTGFVPSSQISNAANLFFGGYVYNNTSKEGPLMSASGVGLNELWPRQAGGQYYAIYGANIGSGADNTDSRGFYLVKKEPLSTNTQGWRNNTLYYTNTPQTNTLSTNEFYLALRNGTGAYSDKTTSFVFVGEAELTNTEVVNFYNAVQAFQTSLGRQV